MTARLLEGIRLELGASGGWMAWNLGLALAPWFLSLVLFRPSRRPGLPWMAAAVGFLLLLPNAPYLLTDVIHLPAAVRREPSDAVVVLVVFPMYAALFTIGFAAYVDMLRRLGAFVVSRGWAQRTSAVELPVHAVCAVAIYVGRIHRLNSWDFVLRPLAVLHQAVAGVTRPLAVLGIVVAFAGLAVGQALARPVLLAVEVRLA
ncbi:MAG: DUF1361 domain-containing protein, partial [Actinobacteria bacterium]|nr:DUF1361 domain-containing protein [Actinomycetota bacterium]